MQVDLCDKKAIENVFDLHRYATKLVADKIILCGTTVFHFPLRVDVQL
jgi:hypothetical protein